MIFINELFEDNTSWRNSAQVPRHFKTEERSKKDEKQQNSHPGCCLMRPCALDKSKDRLMHAPQEKGL